MTDVQEFTESQVEWKDNVSPALVVLPRDPFVGEAYESRQLYGERILDRGEPERAMRILERQGLSRDDPGDPGPGFSFLQQSEVLVVRPKTTAQAAAVRDELSSDYLVSPDVPLVLPKYRTRSNCAGPDLKNTGQRFPGESGIGEAHGSGIRGKGTVVCVMDTGCDAGHTEFEGRTIDFAYIPLASDEARTVYGFDTDGHGTHVTGIAGGNRVGVAPESDLLVASVIESENITTSLRRIAVAIEWMQQKLLSPKKLRLPAVLNLSLGFRPEWLRSTPDAAIAMEFVQVLLAKLSQGQNVAIVAACGNDYPRSPRAPSYFDCVTSVGAVSFAREVANFSSGGWIDGQFHPKLVGYGSDVISSYERDYSGCSWYRSLDGTSMAAPYVTGVAALVASATGRQGRDLVDTLTSDALPLPYPPDRVGHGLARVSCIP